MALARRADNVTDEQTGIPIEGVLVYIYTRNPDGSTGALATLTDDATLPLANPLTTGTSGEFAFWAEEDFYRAEYWFGGRRFRVDEMFVVGTVESAWDASNAAAASAAAAAISETNAETAETGAEAAQTAAVASATAAAGYESGAAAQASAAQVLSATSGVYASTAGSNVPRGATGTGAITGGSGGTNGTFALAFTGGNFSVNPTGTFTVSGGAVTAITITGPGLYIGASPTAPTLSFAASSGLTGASATLTVDYLVTAGRYYWAASSDNAWLELYQNVAGVATATNPLIRVAQDAGLTLYGLGAPDAVTGGVNGNDYIDTTTQRRYGPKASGTWPTTYTEPRNVGVMEEVTVVFMMGQSNADGWATDPQNTTAMTLGYGYEYYHDRGGFGSVLPLGKNRLGRTQGGPQCAFAQTWAAGGGGACVFVDCAVGGSSITSAYKQSLTGTPYVPNLSGGTWDQADADNIYIRFIRDHMRFALDELKRQGFRIRKQVAYWSQGEQDALGNSSQATYDANFRVFLDRFHLDFPDCWFLIENLGENSTGGPAAAANVRAAQVAVAAASTYSPWVKVCSTLAVGFGPSDYADTLHYNQAAYNSLGTQMATDGLTFTKSSGLLAVPGTAKVNYILANMPPVGGWYRMRVQTSANGAWGLSHYSDPTTPYAVTVYDGSGALGVTGVDAAQTVSWTWPDGTSKWVWIYAHISTGASLSQVASANSALTDMQVIDEGFPLNTVNYGTAGSMANGFALSDADIYRLDASKMRDLGINAQSPSFGSSNFTNTALAKLSGLTALRLARTPTVVDLNLALVPNLTTFTQNASGLSVARVNTILQQLDANGKSGGNVNVSQYLASVYAASPPSGAGATAKTSLQGKGWTVTTD